MKLRSLSPIVGGLFVFTLSVGAVLPASAQTLGAASSYNIFVFENHTAGGTDVHGKVAVGGNATYSGYALTSQEGINSGVNNNVTTVVGGNFQNSNYSSGGSIVVGGNAKWTNPTVFGNLSANGSVDFSGGGGSVNGVTKYGTTYTGPGYFNTQQGTTALPVNFAAAKADLTSASTYWGSLANNVTADTSFGGFKVDLSGKSAGTYVVSILDTQLATSYFDFKGSADTSLLINVIRTGTNSVLSVSGSGTAFSGGMSYANLLYNVADSGLATINLNGSFNGNLIAPFATVNATSGAFNGQIVTKTLNSNQLEFHSKNPNNLSESTLFKGRLDRQVPEPGTLALLGGVLPALAFLRRKR